MTYTIIIPIFNEGRTLTELLRRLEKYRKKRNIDIIIIDDGSTDETKNLLIENDSLRIIRNPSNMGKGAALNIGVGLASSENLIFIDGDLEIELDDITKLINKYESGDFDAVVGVRWDKNKFNINNIGNYLINTIFNFLFKSKLNDVLCCLKIFSLNLYKSLSIKSSGFSIEVETMAKLVMMNSSISEELVQYNRRTTLEGKKLKFSDGWAIIMKIIKLKLFN